VFGPLAFRNKVALQLTEAAAVGEVNVARAQLLAQDPQGGDLVAAPVEALLGQDLGQPGFRNKARGCVGWQLAARPGVDVRNKTKPLQKPMILTPGAERQDAQERLGEVLDLLMMLDEIVDVGVLVGADEGICSA
jgi:hypothetical protein